MLTPETEYSMLEVLFEAICVAAATPSANRRVRRCQEEGEKMKNEH